MSFEKIIRSHGMSLTKPRVEIFNLLRAADKPLSMNEIIKHTTGIDRATAYRTVKLFDELHITKRIWFGQDSRIELSDEFVEHHHHIICQSCGKIEKFDHSQIERAINKIAKQSQYKITDHNIEITGLCSKCVEKNQQI